MLKFLGMIFLVLLVFFAVFVICVIYRVRTTLKTLLGNPNLQHPQDDTVIRTARSYSSGKASDMVIDVEVETQQDNKP